MRQAKAWDPSRLLTAASGWVDPQDATSGSSWRYDHYSGYVRLTYHADLHMPACFLCTADGAR